MQPATRAATRASLRNHTMSLIAPTSRPRAVRRNNNKRGAPEVEEQVEVEEVTGQETTEETIVAASSAASLPSPPITPAAKRVKRGSPAKRAVKEEESDEDEVPAAASPSPSPAKPISSKAIQFPATHPHKSHPAVLHLAKVDPVLGAFIASSNARCSLLEPPEHTNTFRALTTSIIFQQLAGNAATSILRKFISVFYPDVARQDVGWSRSSSQFPTPEMVLQYNPETLKGLAGLSLSKATFIHGLAEKYRDGHLSDTLLRTAKTEEQVRSLLKGTKGVGPWTQDMFAMFHLQLLDILPVGDLGVRKAVAQHFDLRKAPSGRKGKAEKTKEGYVLPTAEEMIELAKDWAPYRSVASFYLWRLIDTVTM